MSGCALGHRALVVLEVFGGLKPVASPSPASPPRPHPAKAWLRIRMRHVHEHSDHLHGSSDAWSQVRLEPTSKLEGDLGTRLRRETGTCEVDGTAAVAYLENAPDTGTRFDTVGLAVRLSAGSEFGVLIIVSHVHEARAPGNLAYGLGHSLKAMNPRGIYEKGEQQPGLQSRRPRT